GGCRTAGGRGGAGTGDGGASAGRNQCGARRRGRPDPRGRRGRGGAARRHRGRRGGRGPAPGCRQAATIARAGAATGTRGAGGTGRSGVRDAGAAGGRAVRPAPGRLAGRRCHARSRAVSAAWVAGSVRARAMARRRLGVANARVLAGGDLAAALTMLAASPYQPVSPGSSLAEAQRRVAETLLWHLRVLAGWLPADGAQLLRLLAGWYEIAYVEEHLQALSGAAPEPPYQLGTLATACPRLAGTGSPAELRAALTASAWGDPRGTDPRTISLTMRLV